MAVVVPWVQTLVPREEVAGGHAVGAHPMGVVGAAVAEARCAVQGGSEAVAGGLAEATVRGARVPGSHAKAGARNRREALASVDHLRKADVGDVVEVAEGAEAADDAVVADVDAAAGVVAAAVHRNTAAPAAGPS